MNHERFTAKEKIDTREKINEAKNYAERLLPEAVEREKEIGTVSIDDEGKIHAPDDLMSNDSKREIFMKKGMIDSSFIQGCPVLVYNSAIELPEGCRNLFEINRGAEYDPEDKIIYVDLADSWSYLEDRFIYSNHSIFLPHELRHNLIGELDKKIDDKVGTTYSNTRINKKNDAHTQLAYLDELHSQFFDQIEGTYPRDTFVSIESDFYTLSQRGTHLELVGENEETKETARKLFYYLQGFMLLKEMANSSTDEKMKATIKEKLIKCGAILSISRDIPQAYNLVSREWRDLSGMLDIDKDLNKYLFSYHADIIKGTPKITEDMKKVIFMQL